MNFEFKNFSIIILFHFLLSHYTHGVVYQVIELSAGSAVGKDFGLDKLVNKFFMELTKSASKLSATGR